MLGYKPDKKRRAITLEIWVEFQEIRPPIGISEARCSIGFVLECGNDLGSEVLMYNKVSTSRCTSCLDCLIKLTDFAFIL